MPRLEGVVPPFMMAVADTDEVFFLVNWKRWRARYSCFEKMEMLGIRGNSDYKLGNSAMSEQR